LYLPIYMVELLKDKETSKKAISIDIAGI
jgi:hypothetical protein